MGADEVTYNYILVRSQRILKKRGRVEGRSVKDTTGTELTESANVT